VVKAEDVGNFFFPLGNPATLPFLLLVGKEVVAHDKQRLAQNIVFAGNFKWCVVVALSDFFCKIGILFNVFVALF